MIRLLRAYHHLLDRRAVARRLAEDREVAELDAIWEMPSA